MNLSYWEIQSFFNKYDLVVIGSGIVGLNAALSYRQLHPKHKILVIERGNLPSGASTKNAGFACFGSTTELISDLENSSETLVWDTVELRFKGLKRLKKIIGEKSMEYQPLGGFEVFDSKKEFEMCCDYLPYFNKSVAEITGNKNTYRVNHNKIKEAGLGKVKYCIENTEEGQINTGKMMQKLFQIIQEKKIEILNGFTITNIKDNGSHCVLQINKEVELKCKKVIVATNGFARQLLKIKDVQPARAQVLVTSKIKDLKLNGAFHYDRGYYYFRNIDERILFGGGRNLDLKGEETYEFGLTNKIQSRLERMLKTIILPGHEYKIEHRWSGIMGVGSEKKPIIKHVSPNVVCAVRMGGMGVAIGSLVGEMAAKEIDQ